MVEEAFGAGAEADRATAWLPRGVSSVVAAGHAGPAVAVKKKTSTAVAEMAPRRKMTAGECWVFLELSAMPGQMESTPTHAGERSKSSGQHSPMAPLAASLTFLDADWAPIDHRPCQFVPSPLSLYYYYYYHFLPHLFYSTIILCMLCITGGSLTR